MMLMTKQSVNRLLSGSYSEQGIQAWWNRSRTLLDGKTPTEMFEIDPHRVMELAISTMVGDFT